MNKKTSEEINILREGGQILGTIVSQVLALVQPGISTWKLDQEAEKRIRAAGGVPAFKGYRGGLNAPPFPGTICASVNDEVVHGIPKKECILREGDLFKMDIGMVYKGMITDMARTVSVGVINEEAKKLMDTTRESLDMGISVLKSGAKLYDFAGAVQKHAEQRGYFVTRDLVGHGVGHELHEPPQIPNYVDTKQLNFVFQENMVVALEPMINKGTWKVKMDSDGWTFKTQDGSLSAHFEDTVVITKDGSEILTRI